MTAAPFAFSVPIARLRRRFSGRPWAALIETAARAGYVARGSVYVSIGVIGLMAALGWTPHARGALGALQAWGAWPAGMALLWAVGIGLYGFAGWRALQSLFDAERVGASLDALASRIGQAISGLTYGALAVSVFGLIDAIQDLHEPDEQATTRAFVQHVLDLPFGAALVIGMGLFVIGAGAGSALRAVFDRFARRLDCPPPARTWAGTLARIGYAGRGVALLPAGVFLTAAGWHARAEEARGVGGALEVLAARPFGGLVMGLTAIGLVAFGLFAMLEGWWRPMCVPEPQVE